MAFDLATAVVKLDVVGAAAAAAQIDDVGHRMQTFGRIATLSVTVPLAAAAAGAIKLAADLEQTSAKFETLLGSASRAQAMLKELRSFANSTPFGFRELTDAAGRMLALGTNAKDVLPTLRSIGDAAAALGTGTDGLNGMIRALGQMKAKGSVQAEEMMQLSERGVNGWKYLADTLNTDVVTAMEMVRKKQVDANTAIKAITSGMNRDFGGMMARQAETAAGKFSNLKDKITTIATEIGTKLLPSVVRLMDIIDKLLTRFENLPDGVKTIITAGVGLGALVAPALQTAGSIWSAIAINAAAHGIGAAAGGGISRYAGRKTANITLLEEAAKLMANQDLLQGSPPRGTTIPTTVPAPTQAPTQISLLGRAIKFTSDRVPILGKALATLTSPIGLAVIALTALTVALNAWINQGLGKATRELKDAQQARETVDITNTKNERARGLINRYNALRKSGKVTDKLKEETAYELNELFPGSVKNGVIPASTDKLFKDAESWNEDETVARKEAAYKRAQVAALKRSRSLWNIAGNRWNLFNYMSLTNYFMKAQAPGRIKDIDHKILKLEHEAKMLDLDAASYRKHVDPNDIGDYKLETASSIDNTAKQAAEDAARRIRNETVQLSAGAIAALRLQRDLELSGYIGAENKPIRQALWSKYSTMMKQKSNPHG